MNIVVCVKQTPNTEAKIVVTPDKKDIEKDNLKYIISTYDEIAVEEGLRLREKFGGIVTLVTVGTDKSQEALRQALAMGADKAIQIWDESLEKADSSVIAKVLSKAIQDIGYDVILCGQKAIDTGAGIVGSMLSEHLNIPQVCLITQLEYIDENTFLAHRQIDGGEEIIEINKPFLLTAQKGLNDPRYPTLPNIMKAKKKELKKLSLSDIGLTSENVVPKVQILELSMPPEKKAGIIFKNGENDVPEFVRLLREEAKVI